MLPASSFRSPPLRSKKTATITTNNINISGTSLLSPSFNKRTLPLSPLLQHGKSSSHNFSSVCYSCRCVALSIQLQKPDPSFMHLLRSTKVYISHNSIDNISISNEDHGSHTAQPRQPPENKKHRQ